MVVIVVKILVAVAMCFLLFAAYSLGKQNPTMITGFKWGVTSEEISEDKKWLKKFNRLMRLDIFVTLFAGVGNSFFDGVFCYLTALLVPTLFVVILLSVTMPRGGMRL